MSKYSIGEIAPRGGEDHLILSGTQVRAVKDEGGRRKAEAEIHPSSFTPALLQETSGLAFGASVPHPSKKRVLIIGLDCAEPSLVFHKYRDELPNLNRLASAGAWGELNSVTPPITVPAWMCSMTSKDPGQLGIYGFRNRADYSYEKLSIANARSVNEPTVWDYLGRAGKQSYLLGVPPSFPPKPVNGGMVGCFLSPSTDSKFTFPDTLRDEVLKIAPNYMVDVPNFRTDDKKWLLEQLYEMTEGHYRVIRYVMKEKDWDFLMSVEIGVDRLHHGFWKYQDPAHPKHEPGNALINSIHDYYIWIDQQIGGVLELIDDNTTVIVMSDHGAKKMDGGIAINEWLVNEGYLALDEKPSGVIPLTKAKINWAKTRAWGEGGYYSRVFLNVQGREPNGVIRINEYERIRDELIEKISAIRDHNGKPLSTRVLKPEKIYRATKNIPPDLIVIWGDLYWRGVGSLGLNALHTFENDTGPDDANHAQMGMFIYYDPKRNFGGRELKGLNLYDIAPTVLNEFGMSVPSDMIGKVIRVEQTEHATRTT
jgi:predicted AlkP superfamily phosphohydrolase/phosphomutase